MTDRIRVKFLGNYSVDRWKRQFPHGEHAWGRCDFLFDVAATDYDWLVVYNDLPSDRLEEPLACARSRTLLVTMEPSSIKVYGRAYTGQFGLVLTTQPAWALPHPGRIFSQCGLQWFYGAGADRLLGYDEMLESPPLRKERDIATVCSTKQQRHTLHHKRYRFTMELRELLPELDIFGYGIRAMDDKAEALDGYRYHVAVENYVGPHHWTEKLADAFLGATLPFYHGCPNVADYFPADSFIPIDIEDVAGSAAIIRQAIAAGEYERRLPAILEARRRVMQEYNLFAVLAREIAARHAAAADRTQNGTMVARRLLRRQRPLTMLWDLFDKSVTRVLYSVRNR